MLGCWLLNITSMGMEQPAVCLDSTHTSAAVILQELQNPSQEQRAVLCSMGETHVFHLSVRVMGRYATVLALGIGPG